MLLSLVLIVFALSRWRIVEDRQLIFSTIRIALNDRRSRWAGIFLGILYFTVYMLLGGKGGRIHILFGRLILNAAPWEILTGFVLAVLVAVSMALSVYGMRVKGSARPGMKGSVGFAGTFLALLACFCP